MNRNTWIRSIALVAAGAVAGWSVARLLPEHEEHGAQAHDREAEEEVHAGHEEHDGHGEEEPAEAGDEHGHEESGAEPGAIPDSLLERGGIALDTVRTRVLAERVTLPGTVRHDPSRKGRVAARFPGVLRRWNVSMGDRVVEGQVLGVVEGDATLEAYELRASRTGTVVAVEAAAGQSVGPDQVLAEIADLGSILVDLKATVSELPRLRRGQVVHVRVHPGEEGRRGTVERILPGVDRATQMRTVQVRLPDPRGELGEGLYVHGDVEVGRAREVLAIPRSSLQRSGNAIVVYVRHEGRFEERAVMTGRDDGTLVEILSGLRPGDVVASRGSFVVKADLGKGEAGHDH